MTAATAADRDALQHAESRAVDARRRHSAIDHQLDHAPRRQRRTLRNDLHVAEHQLERAETYLERTRQRAAPAVERHGQAVEDQRAARQRLRTINRLDATPPVVGHHRLHVRALNTWKHWAEGHQVPDGVLRTTVAVLAQRRGPEQQLVIPLRHDLATRPLEREPHGSTLDHDPHAHVPQRDFGIER